MACSEAKVHKQIYKHLENAYEAEQSFVEQQSYLVSLEERDMELYEAIISLNEDEVIRLTKLTEEAIELIDERRMYIDEEKNSIITSKKHFEQTKPLIDQMENTYEKEKLERLYDTMLERYEIYEEVYDTYVEVLSLTENLYEQLQQSISNTLLYETLNDVNERQEQLFKKNNRFNQLTKEYNRLKTEYYKLVWEQ